MPDFDLDRLDSAFAQLRSAATAQVHPPGLEAAQATVSRRRRSRLIAACVALIAVVTISVISMERDNPPVITPQPTPSLTSSPSPGTSPSPSLSPSPSMTPRGGTVGAASPKLIYAARWISTLWESGHTVELPKAQPFAVPYGFDIRGGTAHNVKLTIDVAAIASKVTVVSPGTGCTLSGTKITCNYGTVGPGLHMNGRLTLQAKPGAPEGSAVGMVKLTMTADEPSKVRGPIDGRVSIGWYDQAADITVKSWSVSSVRLGGSATTTVTVLNKGPATSRLQQFGTSDGITPTGASGCDLVEDVAGWLCNHDIPAGATLTVKVTYTVTSCVLDGDFAPFANYSWTPTDPLTSDRKEEPRLQIGGC